MPRLLDHFSAVISDTLAVETSLSSKDGQTEDGSAIRARLAAGVQSAQAEARREVRQEQDLQLANHAVVAWIDEVMLGVPGWGTAVPNLQGELLGTQIARETFFNYLEQLDDDQDEVREVYYVLLCLGFKGYYGELSTGREELERLKDLHGRRLALAPTSAGALAEERLTRQPYGVDAPPPLAPPKRRSPPPRAAPPPRTAPPSEPVAPKRPAPPPRAAPRRPQPRPEPRKAPPKRRRWGLILSLLLVPAALLAVAGFLMLPWWLRGQIDARLTGLDCAAVDAALDDDREIRLTGYVSSDQQREALLADLGGLFGLAGVQDNLVVYPWPFCEVLEVVRPYFDRNIDQNLGLGLGTTAPNRVLKAGDPLTLTIEAPSYPAYLYVDYYQQNGDVGHVAHADANDTPDIAGDKFDYPTGFQGSEPYGTELLTIFASPEPLFETPLPKFEHARTYLPRLRERLRTLSEGPDGGKVAASLVFIRTEP